MIGFIGAGVLGKGLALALSIRGRRIKVVHSRSRKSAEWLANQIDGCRVCDSPQELADNADVVFITTPDAVIGDIVGGVSWRHGQAVVHCCGAATTEILVEAEEQGAVTGAFHPFQTLAGLKSPEDAIARLEGAMFAVSGEGWLRDYLKDLASDLGGHAVFVSDNDRPLYHASAVMGCGYLAALLASGARLWQSMGFSETEAMNALLPLARGTLDSLQQDGLPAAVTGPAVRGDTLTIHAHLEALFQRVPDLLPLYAELTRESLLLAAQRGVAPEQITAMHELADHYAGAE